IFQVLQQRSHDYSASLRYVNAYGAGHRLVMGLTPSWNTVKDDRFINLAGQPGARTGESRQRSRNLAFYAQNQLRVGEAWTLITGAQWTTASRRYEDRFLTNGDQGLDRDYSRASP